MTVVEMKGGERSAGQDTASRDADSPSTDRAKARPDQTPPDPLNGHQTPAPGKARPDARIEIRLGDPEFADDMGAETGPAEPESAPAELRHPAPKADERSETPEPDTIVSQDEDPSAALEDAKAEDKAGGGLLSRMRSFGGSLLGRERPEDEDAGTGEKKQAEPSTTLEDPADKGSKSAAPKADPFKAGNTPKKKTSASNRKAPVAKASNAVKPADATKASPKQAKPSGAETPKGPAPAREPGKSAEITVLNTERQGEAQARQNVLWKPGMPPGLRTDEAEISERPPQTTPPEPKSETPAAPETPPEVQQAYNTEIVKMQDTGPLFCASPEDDAKRRKFVLEFMAAEIAKRQPPK